MLVEAWAVTCAVDVAACYLIAGFIFGRHPAIPFGLLLAIASNAIGLILIATRHTSGTMSLPGGLALLALAVVSAIAMRRSGVESFWPYLLGSGTLSWAGLFVAGVHPALALVPIVPLMPHSDRDEGFFVEPPPHCHDALSCFERFWAPPVQGVLFLLGLVNAGVPLHGLEAGMWAVPISVLVGRPLGVLIATETGVAAGLSRLPRVGWRELIVVGSTASIGLTFALFFGTSVLPAGPLQLQTRSAALFTVLGAATAILIAWRLRVGRFERTHAS
jgi:NhaA family Na+:H+ antiporter